MRSSKMLKTITSFALVAAMVAPALVTSSSVEAAKKPKFSASSVLLATGQSKSVSVKNAVKKAKFSWKSSSSKIAAVKGKGKKATITAKSAGNASITCVVKKGKKKNTVSGLKVKVRQKINTLTMQNSSSKAVSSTDLKVGEKVVLKAAINNNAAGSTTNQTISWTSNNTKVAKATKKNVNSATISAVSAGTAVITAKSKYDGKTATCTVKVTSGTTDKKDDNKATATPAPTEKPLPKGTIYSQKYDVTRWYEDSNKSGITKDGHHHDGYKNDTFAIWMVGFHDNAYSTDEDGYKAYGPDLTNFSNAEFSKSNFDFRCPDQKVLDNNKDTKNMYSDYPAYKGKQVPITLTGEFSYEGKAQKTILLQINYTKPSDYPILWKWEKGADTTTPSNYQKELSISGKKYGSDELKPEEPANVDVTFTIPKDATNGDKDDSGKNYGIYLYFPNRPGGALAYDKSNTFHFKNFKMTYKSLS